MALPVVAWRSRLGGRRHRVGLGQGRRRRSQGDHRRLEAPAARALLVEGGRVGQMEAVESALRGLGAAGGHVGLDAVEHLIDLVAQMVA